MVADFAYYHFNNLSGKLNCSRTNSMQRSISWTKTTKAGDKGYSELKLVTIVLDKTIADLLHDQAIKIYYNMALFMSVCEKRI